MGDLPDPSAPKFQPGSLLEHLNKLRRRRLAPKSDEKTNKSSQKGSSDHQSDGRTDKQKSNSIQKRKQRDLPDPSAPKFQPGSLLEHLNKLRRRLAKPIFEKVCQLTHEAEAQDD